MKVQFRGKERDLELLTLPKFNNISLKNPAADETESVLLKGLTLEDVSHDPYIGTLDINDVILYHSYIHYFKDGLAHINYQNFTLKGRPMPNTPESLSTPPINSPTDGPHGDSHVPHADGRWAFDASVTDNFDDMLKSSIPEYKTMRELTFNLGRNFPKRLSGSNVVDIGASRGEALAPFIEQRFYMTRFHALEISEPMLDVLRTRFQNPHTKIIPYDLRTVSNNDASFEHGTASLFLSILTMIFVPMEHRARVFRAIFKALKPGGALMLVEKVVGSTADIQDLMVQEYHEMKHRHGYSYEEIERKKASLEGVLVPTTDQHNRDMLRQAGFNQIDCYYRSMNFCGLIAIKD